MSLLEAAPGTDAVGFQDKEWSSPSQQVHGSKDRILIAMLDVG